jgi:hypothetical protein
VSENDDEDDSRSEGEKGELLPTVTRALRLSPKPLAASVVLMNVFGDQQLAKIDALTWEQLSFARKQIRRTAFSSSSLLMETAPFVAHKGNLTFRYIAAYLVEGLQNPAVGILSLYPTDGQGRSVSLTGNTHESWKHIDTVDTIRRLFLDKALRGVDFDPNQFKSYLSATNQERVNRCGPDTAFLNVEASHTEDGANVGLIGITDECDYCLAFANGFMETVEPKHKTFLDQSQAFLAFAMPSVSGFDLAGRCIVADLPSGKPLYVITPTGSGRLFTAGCLMRARFQQQKSGISWVN